MDSRDYRTWSEVERASGPRYWQLISDVAKPEEIACVRIHAAARILRTKSTLRRYQLKKRAGKRKVRIDAIAWEIYGGCVGLDGWDCGAGARSARLVRATIHGKYR